MLKIITIADHHCYITSSTVIIAVDPRTVRAFKAQTNYIKSSAYVHSLPQVRNALSAAISTRRNAWSCWALRCSETLY